VKNKNVNPIGEAGDFFKLGDRLLSLPKEKRRRHPRFYKAQIRKLRRRYA